MSDSTTHNPYAKQHREVFKMESGLHLNANRLHVWHEREEWDKLLTTVHDIRSIAHELEAFVERERGDV